MKLHTATLHDATGKPVTLVKDPSLGASEPLTIEQLQDAALAQGAIAWRGCRGYVVALETQTGRDGIEKVVKLEAVFQSLRGESVTVAVPPGEAMVAR